MKDLRTLHDHMFRTEPGMVPVIRKEIYRYLGYRKVSPEGAVLEMTESALAESIPLITPGAICESFPVKYESTYTDLGFTCTESKHIVQNLNGSEHIILLCATIGAKFDRLLFKYGKTKPVMEAVLQSVGAMLIESFLDDLNETLKKAGNNQGLALRPRFSPGFGDFDLSVQKDIFRALRTDRIGVTLTDSLLMAPTKSVTAIIGLKSIGENDG